MHLYSEIGWLRANLILTVLVLAHPVRVRSCALTHSLALLNGLGGEHPILKAGAEDYVDRIITHVGI